MSKLGQGDHSHPFCLEALLPTHMKSFRRGSLYNPPPRGNNLKHIQNPKGCTKEPRVACGSLGGIHSAFTIHTGYQGLVSGLGSLSISISPADWEPLVVWHRVSQSLVPLEWCLVHSRHSVSYKAARSASKRKILVQE